MLPLGSLRIAPGAGVYATPHSAFNFDFDLTAGFRLGMMVDDVWIAPLIEAGYSYHGGDRAQGEGDYFVAGGGLSVGTIEVAATIVPAYIVGDADGDLVHGMRTALRADFWMGIWSIEAAHEWRSVRSTDVHSIRFTLTIDFGILLSWALRASGPRPEPTE
ncbi:MAG: hypothetical protein M5U28_41910 [Sandaracinaceae bacterium]|nr:hypothetical protein [Sandaracinaceae bacterium]